MLGESAFIAGDTAYSMNIQRILLEDARRRRNPLNAAVSTNSRPATSR
jgi:hypothetical protein